LSLPFIHTGQAQKEVTHNEALQRLDLLVQATCNGVPSNTPPTSPAEGQGFLCGDAPTGPWAGQANALAQWTIGGWRFAAPFEGMRIASITDARDWSFVQGAWSLGMLRASELRIGGVRVVGQQAPAIAAVSGGVTLDSEARAAIVSILNTLRAHGLIAA